MEDLTVRIDQLTAKIDQLVGTKPEPPVHFENPRPALGVRCPQCNKRALRKAKRESILDRLALVVLFAPYRCRYCRYFEMRFILEDAVANRMFGSKGKK